MVEGYDGQMPLRKLSSIALILGLVAAFLWLDPKSYKLPSDSMRPGLAPGDRVLTMNLPVDRGDVVIVHPNEVVGDPNDGNTRVSKLSFVRRVVGLPGESIGVRAGHFFVCKPRALAIDHDPLKTPGCRTPSEPYASGEMKDFLADVPNGAYFVLGDNRERSVDSRQFGPVKASQITHVGVLTYWPLSRLAIP